MTKAEQHKQNVEQSRTIFLQILGGRTMTLDRISALADKKYPNLPVKMHQIVRFLSQQKKIIGVYQNTSKHRMEYRKAPREQANTIILPLEDKRLCAWMGYVTCQPKAKGRRYKDADALPSLDLRSAPPSGIRSYYYQANWPE